MHKIVVVVVFCAIQPIQNLMRASKLSNQKKKAEQKAIISIYVVREIACSEAQIEHNILVFDKNTKCFFVRSRIFANLYSTVIA